LGQSGYKRLDWGESVRRYDSADHSSDLAMPWFRNRREDLLVGGQIGVVAKGTAKDLDILQRK
jgi:hypothetical protein